MTTRRKEIIVIVGIILAFLILIAPQVYFVAVPHWKIVQSPLTGQCYEVLDGRIEGIALIDDRYCE